LPFALARQEIGILDDFGIGKRQAAAEVEAADCNIAGLIRQLQSGGADVIDVLDRCRAADVINLQLRIQCVVRILKEQRRTQHAVTQIAFGLSSEVQDFSAFRFGSLLTMTPATIDP
jgi:hypothetical protein